MAHEKELEMFTKGIEAVDKGDTSTGLRCLEGLFETRLDPFVTSYYAVCLAKERGEVEKALFLCREASEEDPGNPVHYLNRGRVLLAGGRKREAIKVFRDGLLYGKNQLIKRELDMLGWRKPPVISWLGREHPLNRSLGRIFHQLGLR
jgi:predicted Zn-dependent protease